MIKNTSTHFKIILTMHNGLTINTLHIYTKNNWIRDGQMSRLGTSKSVPNRGVRHDYYLRTCREFHINVKF